MLEDMIHGPADNFKANCKASFINELMKNCV